MAKSHLPAYSAKIHPSNEPETDPNSYSLEKFKLYETRARFYLIGSDRNKRFFRVLKIDRSEPSDLNISEDPVVYSPQEIKNLLQRISEGNRATGGLTFVAKVFGIAGCIKFLESYYLILVTKRRQIGCICGHAIYSIDESQLITIPHVSIQSDVAHSKTELSYLKRGVNDRGRVANDVETEQVVLDEEAGSCKGKMSSVVQMRGSIPLFWSQEASRFSPKPDIILQRYDPTYQATKMHFEDLAKRYGNPIIVLNLIKTVEKRPREMMLRREFANAVGYLNTILSEENQVRFIHWDFHKFAKSKSANVLAVLGGVASEALDLTGFYYSGKSCITKKRTSQLRDLRASSGDLARVGSCNESLNSVGSRERDADFYQQSKTNSPDGAAPCFQSGVLRTNCIDCLDRTNVAQYAYGLAALGRQLHAMGLTDMPKVNPNSSIAAALMDMYQSMGDALAQQYGGSAAHNTVFPERQGKWKATTQSREFLKSIKRYYSNAYTDGEKQDAINLFLGYFQPQEGKPALWELDSDYYLHVSGIGDDLFPEKCLEGSAKAVGIGRKLAPIPACREDFSRMKLTSFDKLIERTCSSIKNVRLCSEPDQRPGGVAGNSGVAPDAAEIQLKSPNWLFGQRKLEGSGAAAKVTTNETANREVRRETRGDSFCDLNWLSSADDINDEDIFQRYSAMTYADEANGWYGGTLLGDQDENSEIYKHYAELCQGPAMEPFEHDHEREKYYADVLRMNTIDVVDDHAVEAEMVAALSEYEQIGANLGIIPTSCKSFAEDPSQLSRWMIGEEKLQRV
ncbi:phosphatidylinositol-3-phosphatase SAC1 [Citrus sinensis]|uniref:Phosphatidylinositol-3-phosphatase SAC1 n=1 Tax=Citrus sinensis TaxID=2711 RepID=A0ACB8KUF3_CITSI|nr:phosphatidylinositol-3-phosphatase SAC1 [Citrus sinensis]